LSFTFELEPPLMFGKLTLSLKLGQVLVVQLLLGDL
jgi:hypothetical protein